MPAAQIRAQYGELEEIFNKFMKEGSDIADMLDKVKNSMQPLEDRGWIGKGSDEFFKEMRDDVLPAVRRLRDACEEAANKTKEISEKVHQAEDEAGLPFRNIIVVAV